MPSLIPALRFMTTSDQVDCGSPTLLDDLQYSTIFGWVRIEPTASGDLRFYQKGYLATVSTYHYLYYTTSTGLFGYAFNRTTSDQTAIAAGSQFPAFGLGRWLFLCSALHWTDNAQNNFWVGSLSLPPSLPATYSTQSAGSGSLKSDAAANVIWGQRGGASNSAQSAIAMGGLFPSALNHAQVTELWAASRASLLDALAIPPHQFGPNLVALWRFGANGLRSVVDESGFGNHGAVSGSALFYTDAPVLDGWRSIPVPTGSVYNLLLSLGFTSVATVGGQLTLSPSVALQTAGGASPNGPTTMALSLDMAVTLAQVVSGGLTVQFSTALGLLGASVVDGVLQLNPSLSLATTANLSESVTNTLALALALASQADVLTSLVGNIYSATLSLSLQSALTEALQTSLNQTLALSAASATSSSRSVTMSSTLLLDLTTAIAEIAQATCNTAVSLGTVSSVSPSLVRQINAILSLQIASQLLESVSTAQGGGPELVKLVAAQLRAAALIDLGLSSAKVSNLDLN